MLKGNTARGIECGETKEWKVEIEKAFSTNVKVTPALENLIESAKGLWRFLSNTFTVTVDIKPVTEDVKYTYKCTAAKHAEASEKKGHVHARVVAVPLIDIYAIYNDPGKDPDFEFKLKSFSLDIRLVEPKRCVE